MEFSSSSLPILPCNFHFLSAADLLYKLRQTHPSLTLLSKCKSIQSLKQVHTHTTKTGLHITHFALSKIIEFSTVLLFGDLSYALSVFESIENPSHPIEAMEFYLRMILSGAELNSYAFPFPFKLDLAPMPLDLKWIMHVYKSLLRDAVSFTALISGYRRGAWNAMISGYAQSGRFEEVLALFVEMLKANTSHNESIMVTDYGLGSNLHLVSALINMYSKCGAFDIARGLFDGLLQRDVISTTTKEALMLFRLMLQSSTEPNDVTFLVILPTCDHLGALDLDKWIHAYIDKNFQSFTNTSLWTSLIGIKSSMVWKPKLGFLKWDAHATLNIFSKMEDEGFKPNATTFVGVLSACNHGGLVNLGRQYFSSMTTDYHISPELHNYGCMKDLLGLAGLFDEDSAVWGSLLRACRLYRGVELREYVAKHLFKLEPENARSYVLLSNIYAGAGRWDDMERIRTSRLNDLGIKKVPGSTSIKVDNVVHEFLVSDKSHPLSKQIYEMLEEIDRRLYTAGFVPDTSEEVAFSHHSEKLAIAFGLISTKAGTTIRIVKNLRVSRNCHSATKLTSKIFNREIIARDGNRFHHFRDASCPCNVNC
ncbi:pentatricopeptide repeat-containing protein [Pyrus ussuriensis x Pyrus communis]|uniref:Pentatricopeptide repeat-containing protein n=1 Tax=Pyrus ussuriensis x Pyrus communis TaxID=2448454 RepID=A0A5N5G3Q0_9ROSA|nr:pentatricopeptide repeat-containing protein [Pyrus ussuriensis x Pyrus communis]